MVAQARFVVLNKVIGSRVAPVEARGLKALAVIRGVSLAELIRLCINEYLTQNPIRVGRGEEFKVSQLSED